MARNITRLRPPTLSSTGARQRLGHRQEVAFSMTLDAIDTLAGLYDGLDAVRSSQSPLQTPEANALTYKRQYEAAVTRAEGIVKAQLDRLLDYEMGLRSAATRKAGLGADPAGGNEIRAALRGMSQKARDHAVVDAITRGDASVIAAIVHSPSAIVTGPITAPVETLTAQFVEKANPELRETLDEIEIAADSIGFAWQGFSKGTADMRDVGAEDRGEIGEAAARSASATLAAAMGGV